jgi:hypothetical protein
MVFGPGKEGNCMPQAPFALVFTAEARALMTILNKEVPSDQNGGDFSDLKAVIKTLLPDIVETPARMKRLNDALVDWLMAGPRNGRAVEAARAEFSEILETHMDVMSRICAVATSMGFPNPTLNHLKTAMEEVDRIRDAVFKHWQPFTKADYEAALEEMHQGQGLDLDEVIRELQGGLK